MPDIFTTPTWTSSTAYNKDAFVTNGGRTYYALDGHTSTANFTTDLNNGHWDGIITINGEAKPKFIWKASYGYNFNIKPAVKTIQFSEGYSQDIQDGINNILLPFEVSFQDRGLDEYSAILHFLHARNGVEKFYLVLPAPFNVWKKFVCSEWNATQTFYDKYTVTAKFQEKV